MKTHINIFHIYESLYVFTYNMFNNVISQCVKYNTTLFYTKVKVRYCLRKTVFSFKI